MKIAGNGVVCDVMGRVRVEFENGVYETEDQNVIDMLLSKGFEEYKEPVTTGLVVKAKKPKE